MALSSSIKKHLQTLNLSGKRKEALSFLRKYISSQKSDSEAKLKFAWFLYHVALDEEKGKKMRKHLTEAKKIYETVLKNKLTKDKLSIMNARMCLAQIMAILGEKEAIKIAKENFSSQKSVLMSNRLADVYWRLGDNQKALWWFKKSERLAGNNKKDLLVAKLALLNFYKRQSKKVLAKKYQKKFLNLCK